jgi:hypothetical protein
VVLDGVDGVREIKVEHGDYDGAVALSTAGTLDVQYPSAMIFRRCQGERLQLKSTAPFSVSDSGSLLTDVMGRCSGRHR